MQSYGWLLPVIKARDFFNPTVDALSKIVMPVICRR
jgi:hypothetical protein